MSDYERGREDGRREVCEQVEAAIQGVERVGHALGDDVITWSWIARRIRAALADGVLR